MKLKLFSGTAALILLSTSFQGLTFSASAESGPPTFSQGSGFYSENFDLSLSSDGEIYYTLDGSNPIDSDTTQIYTEPITISDRTQENNIWSVYAEDENSNQSVSRGCGYKSPTHNVDKSTVVRAVTKYEDGTYSDVSQQTYFVTTEDLAEYEDLTVISMVTDPDNLFDPDTGIYVTGNQYLEWKNSSSYDATKSVWDTNNVSNFFSKGKEWEREANITIFEDGEAVYTDNMGIRIKGASTRNTPQKSFNLYARSEYGNSKIKYAILPDNTDEEGNVIQKYDSISLRSVSSEERLRDSYSEGLLTECENLTTADMKPCVLFLDGEYWGLYMITEKISDYFIQSNYGIPKENVAIIKANEIEEGDESECNDFITFAEKYSQMNLSDPDNYQAVCDYIDIDSMIEHYAAGIYLGTYDWPNYNYGVWRNTGEVIEGNPYSDGKWRFITYDMDYTCGKTYDSFGGVEGYAYDNFQHIDKAKNHTPTNLFVALLQNETFKLKFAKEYYNFADNICSTERTTERLDLYSETYGTLLAESTTRWWGFYGGTKSSNFNWNQNQYLYTTIPQIKTFFNNRARYTLEDMEEYLGVTRTDLPLDLSHLQNYLLGKETSSTIEDINDDGVINGFDLALARQN